MLLQLILLDCLKESYSDYFHFPKRNSPIWCVYGDLLVSLNHLLEVLRFLAFASLLVGYACRERGFRRNIADVINASFAEIHIQVQDYACWIQ